MLTLSTDSLTGYGLERIFNFIKEAKYDGLDLKIDQENFDTTNADYLKELINKYGINITALQTPSKVIKEDIEGYITLAKKIGCKIIIIQPPRIFSFKYKEWLKFFVPRIRKQENISIALENAPNSTILGIIPEYGMNSLNDLKQFKHACLDTSRLAQKKLDIIRSCVYLQDFLVHLHLSNIYRSHPYYLPQKGILAIESLLTKLKQEKFKGAISIKVKPKYLDVGHDEKVLQHLKEMKLFYEEYFLKK